MLKLASQVYLPVLVKLPVIQKFPFVFLAQLTFVIRKVNSKGSIYKIEMLSIFGQEKKGLKEAIFMSTRDSAIAKLQQLSEPLLQEVNNFIDFVIRKHQAEIDSQTNEKLEQKWLQWFEDVDRLNVISPNPTSIYQQLLLNKYQQHSLEL